MAILKYFPYVTPLEDEFYLNSPYKDSPLRRAKILLFRGSMRNYKGFRDQSNKIQVALVINIEIGCFNQAISVVETTIIASWKSPTFVKKYSSNCHRVAENIDCKSQINSTYLIEFVLKYPEKACEVGSMAVEDLVPHHNVEILEKIKSRLQSFIEVKYTSMYPCSECGKRQAKMRRVQLRGQDEGASTVCVCICGFGWTLE